MLLKLQNSNLRMPFRQHIVSGQAIGNIRNYRASYLPSLVLFGTMPNYNRSIKTISTVEGDVFSPQQSQQYYAGMSLNQKIGVTGGTLSLNSDLTRLDNITDTATYINYNSNILNITYSQPIFKYNSYKWERKTEPIKYDEAKKKYLEDMEQVALNATNLFFNLLTAQINEKIALINEANYDTLYKIAQGRFNLGRIAENELLQLELQYLNARSAVKETQLATDNQLFQFKSFLRIKDDLQIRLIEPSIIEPFEVNPGKAIEEARANSSQALDFNLRLIVAESNVDQAKLDGRFDADLFAVYGLTNNTQNLNEINKNPLDNQQLRLGIQFPILDWGVARGKIKIAESNQEIEKLSVEQGLIDFNQQIFLKVARFNMQYDQVMISAKSDTVAQKGYEVTKARYLIGKISITDLNIAQVASDDSRRNYIDALWTYWRNYYDLRRMTLFDFKNNTPILVDYSKLL